MAKMEMVCNLKYWPFFKNKASVLSIKEQKTNRVLFSLWQNHYFDIFLLAFQVWERMTENT